VPQAAGSATDTVARILAAELGPQLGGVTIWWRTSRVLLSPSGSISSPRLP